MADKFICIHAHFYQPPRENPWLEEVETEESAAPFHDWNQRITKECYAPNTAARILGAGGRIAAIASNYEKISFNFGPTLLSWMERHDPETYHRILEADRASIRARGGHGNAIAQVYNHSIMPLNSARDKETQIIWGIKDFEFRFGRKPEGMWFAETAVDAETLAIAAAHGIKFTILSPRQARRVRPLGGPGVQAWTDVHGNPNTRRPYLYRPDQKHEMAIFFYDGDAAHSIAFEGALYDGVGMAKMLLSRFAPAPEGDPQLVHVATDGESYGHHHKFGEMALVSALAALERNLDVAVVNYSQYLDGNSPQWEADIFPLSSWSCMHGVDRWRNDCGCNTGGEAGWNQKWRGPLREALNGLKAAADAVFEEGLGRLFIDPWAARNDYVEVCLKRTDDRIRGFFARHQKTPLSDEQSVTALKHLEMQKMAMRMYTSCGWFFSDISGLESKQILKYAARVIDFAQELSLKPLEGDFVKILEKARSNIAKYGTGADIYRRDIMPMRLNPMRMAAHAVISDSLAPSREGLREVYCYQMELHDRLRETYLESAMMTGMLDIRNLYTLERRKLTFCLLHFGLHDFSCFIHPFFETADYQAAKEEVAQAWQRRSVPELIRTVEKYFGQTYYTVTALFDDQRRRVMEQLLAPHVSQFAETYETLFNANRALMDFHASIKVPVPAEFRIAARYVFERQIGRLFLGTASVSDHATMALVIAEAARWGVSLDYAALARNMTAWLEYHAELTCADKERGTAEMVAATLEEAASAGVAIDMRKMQDSLYPHYLAYITPAHPQHKTLRGIKDFGRVLELSGFFIPPAD